MLRTNDIKNMLNHWLTTKPNGYFGSTYGCPLNELLLRRQSEKIQDKFFAKMRKDIPLLDQLAPNQINLFESNNGYEKKDLYLQVGEIFINLNEIKQV